MKSVVHFSKIVIIQSLKDNELHTGAKLHEDIDFLNDIHERGLKIELCNIETKFEFTELIRNLTVQANNDADYPVLHIETHGSDDKKGLILSSGGYVDWNELKFHAINLNIATKNNLLLVFAACHGANFTRMLAPSDRSPCWGLVGPVDVIAAHKLLEDFSAFYREVFQSGDGGKAINALNKTIKPEDINYYFTTSEQFFINTYNNYIVNWCGDKEYGKRERQMRKQLKKQKIRPLASVSAIKRMLSSSQEEYFEKYKTKFFMYDLYPENAARFNVNYTDVMKNKK